MSETQVVLGPPEVLWLDEKATFEHFTGRSPRTVLRDYAPAGLKVYERGDRDNPRRYILHSEYIAFLKATSRARNDD